VQREFEHPTKYPSVHFAPYLSAPFRQLLFSAELDGPHNQGAVCGETASLFVHGVQDFFGQCEGEGDVSDKILSYFPQKLEESWNGEPWTSASFMCPN